MGDTEQENAASSDGDKNSTEKLFTLKKWNAVAMWSWDVECDTCAICRVQVMGKSWKHNLIQNLLTFLCLST